MRRNKIFSTLSVAAVALLAAAVPCFAQDQSSGSKFAAPGSGFELVFMRQARAIEASSGFGFVEPKDAAQFVHMNKSSTLRLAFINATRQFTFMKNQLSFDPQTIRFEAPSLDSKKQFRTDDEIGAERAKRRVTFVPSRGPKVPS